MKIEIIEITKKEENFVKIKWREDNIVFKKSFHVNEIEEKNMRLYLAYQQKMVEMFI